MCINRVSKFPPSRAFYTAKKKQRSKKPKVQVLGLTRKRCQEEEEKDMEVENLKLFLENKKILEENMKLRKTAILLHQENLALISEFEKKFPK